MHQHGETVGDRIQTAKQTTSITELATLLVFAAAILFVLTMLQDPVAHDSLHNFRHAAGVVCH